jgi:quinol monooxygenase YgiN
MYGLIGKMRAAPGRRDDLVAILLDVRAMPGCLNYIVATDPNDPDAIWVTEVWTDKASHSASLQLPEVRAAIAQAMPIIAGFESQTETIPLGGLGI